MAIAEAYYNEENYGVSLMGAAQSTAVDIARCAEAIRSLAEDDAKRKAFGASGRARAQNTFDWKHIIRAYEDLWRELAEKRRAAAKPGVPQELAGDASGLSQPVAHVRELPDQNSRPR